MTYGAIALPERFPRSHGHRSCQPRRRRGCGGSLLAGEPTANAFLPMPPPPSTGQPRGDRGLASSRRASKLVRSTPVRSSCLKLRNIVGLIAPDASQMHRPIEVDRPKRVQFGHDATSRCKRRVWGCRENSGGRPPCPRAGFPEDRPGDKALLLRRVPFSAMPREGDREVRRLSPGVGRQCRTRTFQRPPLV